jgi:hypothetical protein
MISSCAKPAARVDGRVEDLGPNFRQILPVLVGNRVRFIVIGGGAALAHGAARLTYDVEVVYSRDPENLGRLARALQPFRLTCMVLRPVSPFAGMNSHSSQA